ncbi:enoyl-CoA hydratase [Ectobacillus ponti]|uniref:Enoyl-CoA hydratase n=1 Tax=Ectobacillus ponti TaxID=2961894 RepID=A0AA42BQ40_9BACI|nr:enoyl-CoA hydratase [Ectobacillus ponti]MCP8969011.1 enoyl-CoA hydratase [Ectobacillus ponti]
MTLLRVEKEAKTAVVTIDNPPLNVMCKAVLEELRDAFRDLAADADVNAIILTGAGQKAFMAGADIKEFPQWIGRENLKDMFLETHEILNAVASCPKPVIAVLNGITFGGGCELALACDLRIAEEHAQIGLPEIKLGLFPGGGGTQRLPRLIGGAKAKELMFTGDPISASEAKAIGLVNQVAPAGEGLAAAQKLAGKISGYSLQALTRIKKAVDEGMNTTLQQGLVREAELFEEVFQTEDIKEGVQAFLEKRRPAFTGR